MEQDFTVLETYHSVRHFILIEVNSRNTLLKLQSDLPGTRSLMYPIGQRSAWQLKFVLVQLFYWTTLCFARDFYFGIHIFHTVLISV